MNAENKPERQYAIYVLRVWVDPQTHEQRFRLEELHSGNGLVFHSANDLADYLRNVMLPQAAPYSLPADLF